jgi:hypothetical protein
LHNRGKEALSRRVNGQKDRKTLELSVAEDMIV